MSPFWNSVARHAAVTFVATFVPLVSGILAAPNWDAQKAAAIAAIGAALAAALRAAIAVASKGESPFPDKGV
jgi:hypothetical protein